MQIGRLVILNRKKPASFYAETFYIINLPFLPMFVWINKKSKK